MIIVGYSRRQRAEEPVQWSFPGIKESLYVYG
jgi:hypothetical protein